MRNNDRNKGFTLVEILAVIIILAVITLITVPIITNAVKSARKGSFKVSAQNIIKAADAYYGKHGFEMNKVSTFDFSKNEGKNEAGEQLLLSGKMPISGKVVVSKQGDIVLSDISDGTYYANYDSTIDDQVVITETSEVLTRDELTEQLKDLQKKFQESEKKIQTLEKQHQTDVEKTNQTLATTTATANSANTLATTLNSTRLNKTYPIGSIYISYSNTNPASLFGGTWENYGTGKTLVGVDTSQTEFNSVGKTGGEKSHLLTVSEMPSHRHDVSISTYDSTVAATTSTTSPILKGYQKFGSFTNLLTNYTMTETGGNGAHNNLQPYITVYMWRRIA